MEQTDALLAKKYADKILRLRQKERLTQKQFAEKIGSSQTMVYYWEKGDVLISTSYLHKICNTFNISMAYWDDDSILTEPLSKKEFNEAFSQIAKRLHALEIRMI